MKQLSIVGKDCHTEGDDFNLADIAEVWRRGSVIASWRDLTAAALVSDPHLVAELQDRLLSAMRFEYGGHIEKAADK